MTTQFTKILKKVVRTLKDKVIALLGFAAKAGSVCFGAAESIAAVRSKKAKCVFFASDISKKSRKEILFHCDRSGATAYELNGMSMDELSHGIGRKCAVVAVTNDSFCKPIVSYLTSDI